MFGRPDGIGPPGTSSIGKWPKRSAPISSPGTILSQMPSSAARLEHAVAERDRRAHGDHVAAEQRQVHAGLALRHAVAHRRHAAGDLRGRPDLARENLHLLGVAAIGRVRRQHVVVSGDDADVGAAKVADRVLVGAGAGETVREIAAARGAAGLIPRSFCSAISSR